MGDRGSPGSTRNVDSRDTADSAETVDRVAVTLEGRSSLVVSADRKVYAVRIDPRPATDLRKNDCPIGVMVVPVEVRLWDHYLSNFWETVADLAVSPESLAVVKERLASPGCRRFRPSHLSLRWLVSH